MADEFIRHLTEAIKTAIGDCGQNRVGQIVAHEVESESEIMVSFQPGKAIDDQILGVWISSGNLGPISGRALI